MRVGWASARKKSLLRTCRGVGIYIDITIYNGQRLRAQGSEIVESVVGGLA